LQFRILLSKIEFERLGEANLGNMLPIFLKFCFFLLPDLLDSPLHMNLLVLNKAGSMGSSVISEKTPITLRNWKRALGISVAYAFSHS